MTDIAFGDIDAIRKVRRPAIDGLALLQGAGDAAVSGADKDVVPAAEKAVDYLRATFLPLCEAEEFTLFISIDGAIGAPHATAVMQAQHRSLAAMAADLGKVTAAAKAAGEIAGWRQPLATLSYALYGFARGHLEAEDDAYVDLLEGRLSESQASALADNLGRVSRARGHG